MWLYLQFYREVLTLLLEGRLDIAIAMLLAVMATVGHAKGIEDVFKYLRRLTRKGAENHRVSIDRLYAIMRHSCVTTFPNVQQETVGQSDFERPCFDTPALQAAMR